MYAIVTSSIRTLYHSEESTFREPVVTCLSKLAYQWADSGRFVMASSRLPVTLSVEVVRDVCVEESEEDAGEMVSGSPCCTIHLSCIRC